MTETYDVILIGGGPAGYQAAIRAGQLGLKVACVDDNLSFGGTCLRVGCIPSKALLESSERLVLAREHLAEHGVEVASVALNLEKMMAQKVKVVSGLAQGIEYLFRKNKVVGVKGRARFVGPDRIVVAATEGERELTAKHLVIATGSEIINLPGVTVDEARIVSSSGALSLERVPGRLVIIGAGIIGLELGSVWRRLGAEVTILEYLDRITPGVDAEVAKTHQKILEKDGFKFRLGVKVVGARHAGEGVAVQFQPRDGGAEETIEADILLSAVGRRPFTEGLGLDAAGVQLDERGRIAVDERFRTNVPGVYAIGDVIRGARLGHKASEEGVVLMEQLAGIGASVDYETIPSIIYTAPEVAWVGRTEEELKAHSVAYRAGKFPFNANARARAQTATDGFAKVLADAKTDRVLGVHVIGPNAGTIIHEAVAFMAFGGAAEDMARVTHAHPTLSEVLKEAALAVEGRPLGI